MKRLISSLLLALCLTLVVGPAWGKATVLRDPYGIPSIQADTEEELFEEFGYTAAVDRLWQMEVNKRWGRGTMAEIFGPRLVPADIQNRLMGYTEEEYQAIFEKYPPDYQKFMLAYLKGVNRRVEEVAANSSLLPLEFQALKLKPQHFTVGDSFAFTTALLRRFGMIGGGELKNLAALQALTERFGQREGWAVFNDWCWLNDPSAPTYIQEKINGDFVPGSTLISRRPSYLRPDQELTELARAMEKLSARAEEEALRVGAPVKMGSYSWTLSPQVTGTGYPILMGQPQMEHPVPSIIFEVQLKGAGFDVAGMAFPLNPTISIGHNRNLAWSHMVGMCDNVDVYQEVLNPLNKEEYLYKGAWRKMSKRTEKISVAGGEGKEVTIYRTLHGPVFSPFPFEPSKAKINLVYTKKLAHWQKEPLSLAGWWKIMIAKNARDFGAAMSFIMTSLHTTYADTGGNIGYWHSGLNPERPEGFDPRLPLPGTGEAEWTGRYRPNAQVLNPPKGFVAGWNNKASIDTRNPFDERGDYHSFGRYHRCLWVERALAGRRDLNLEANREIIRFVGGAGALQNNQRNAFGGAGKDLLPLVARAVDRAREDEKSLFNRVLAVLASWDGRSVRDVVMDERFQAGHTIFVDWFPRVVKATFVDELEGIENFEVIYNQLLGLFFRCLDGPTSALPVSRNYFNNVRTQKGETAEDIFLQTLRETAGHLRKEFKSDDPATWKGPRTKIIFRHPLFGQVAEMWDNNIGSYVQIVELRPEGAVGYSRWPLGQSGNITMGVDKKPAFDPHFFDLLPLYKDYTYRKMGMD